ncbi:hypothetical protein JZ751_007941 [Albula glossodonta]|uniref:Tail specific protease domain-containing protein n=1 Tax=Albula glossodonta TaxID=121402 RepID=A0A8T2NYH3_9TELE|nr:hypothetical protein JZ751_007941 [Albula glossodonta]
MSGTLILLVLLAYFNRLLPVSTSFQPALVLDMAKILQENYCFPENLVGMQEAIQQAISSGEILHILDRQTLAAVLTTGVQGALHDPRLIVSYEPNYVPIAPSALPPLTPEQPFGAIQSSIYAEVLESDVGYLRIDHLLGEEVAQKIGPLLLSAVWDRVVHTSALILDLRYSTDGEMSGIPFIASYLTDPDPTIHLDTVYDRPSNTSRELWTRSTVLGERYGKGKDVIILTSKGTMGAAEGLAYTLKHLRRAIIVGERTAGGSIKIEKLRIGESDFYITIPVARSISPVTGRSWEVVGVLPCVPVHAKEAIARAKSLIEVRSVIPKTVQCVSDIIKGFYSFTDRVPALLQKLSSIDFFTVKSEEDLATKLNLELQMVSKDPRLIIKEMTEPPVIIEEDSEPAEMNNDPSFLEVLVDNLFQAKVLPGNTGYLRFDEFGEASKLVKLGEQIVRKVWDLIKDTDNLIIDLRYNIGGPSAAVPLLLSYLHDPTPEVHFFTIYDRIRNSTTKFHTLPGLLGAPYGLRRGVYVLTSQRTATAGEEFAYLTQTLHRGTVIGEVTSGTLLHSKSFQVEDTNIVVTIPFMNFIDNNGECWLGGGVVPDAIVLAQEALDQAHKVIGFHQEVHSLVEGTGELLEIHYAIPEVATKVRKVLRSKWAEGSYRSVVNYESLAFHLTADLQETTGDHRLQIFHRDAEPKALQEAPKIPTPEEVQDVVNSLFKVEILPGNVGYLRFDMMANVEVIKAVGPQLLDLVWNKLLSTDTMIVDMRYNTGGYSTAIPLLCSYFFNAEPTRHLYTMFDRSTTTMTDVMTLPEVLGKRYGSDKDMYILTSRMTGSAAEAFTRTMKDLNRALVIGEPTIGGSLSSGTYQIGDSFMYASIPNQVLLSAVTGKVWSVSGVEPHVIVQADDALNKEAHFPSAVLNSGKDFEKMARALLLLASLVVFSNVLAIHSAFPPSLIAEMAKVFMDSYCYPEKLAGMQEAIAEASSNTEILNIPDPGTLASVLTAGVQSTINDPRVVVSHEPNYVPITVPVLPPLPPEQLIDIVKSSVKVDVLENNIGYLRIDHIMGEAMAEKIGPLLLENVWSKVLQTSALIFDLRHAATGDVTGIPYIVSYFTNAEPSIHIDDIYDRPSDTTKELWSLSTLLGQRYGSTKDLIILTSKHTSGVPEDVTYALKSLKRATVIGEKTAGGSVKVEKLKVGDTDFYITVPVSRSTSAITGKSWEVTGVSPSVSTDAANALDVALKALAFRTQIPAIVEAAASLVADNYAFAPIAADVAGKLKELLAKGDYRLVSTDEELKAKLSADLATLSGDKNLKTAGTTAALLPLDNPTPEMFAELIKVSFHTDVFENNIGYLRFDMFGDFEQVAAIAQIIVDNVWSKVVNTDALIVDLRYNVGGPTTSIAGFCSYFFDANQKILLDTLYSRPSGKTTEMWTLPELTGQRYGLKKSLIILTSDVTAGAAEEFVYIMKKLGRAMIVGAVTSGGSHPPEKFRIGETDIFLSIPVTHSDTTQGPAWEGAGISPHIPVPAEAALDTAKGILNKHFAGQK